MSNVTEHEDRSAGSSPRRNAAELVRETARKVIAAVGERPVTAIATVIGLCFVGQLALLQLATLPLPIFAQDGHHWRQSFTFGVAWNFAHTTSDILRPRMFLELDKSNIIAMEPPLYPLLISWLLKISGDSVFGPRLVSWLALVASVVVLWRMLGLGGRKAWDTWADRAGLLVAVSVSTMMATDFRSVQPEPMAAGLSMLAAFYFIRYRDSERRRDVIIGAVFTALALLTKPVVLGILPGLALFAVWGPGRWQRRALVVSAALLPGLALYAAWDRWAAHLLVTELNGYALIAIGHDVAAMLQNLQNVGYAREAVLHLLPNYAGSWWLTPALVAGMFRALSEPRLRRFGVPFLVWLVGYLAELLAFGDRLHSNAYYVILAPAPIAYFAALGVGAMVRVLDSGSERPSVKTFRVGLAVFVLLPLSLTVAKRANWSSTEVAHLGLQQNRAVWTSDIGLLRMFGVLLATIALGPSIRPPHIAKYLGAPLVVAVLSTGLWARRDAEQYLRFFAAVDKRAGFREELAALRAAVAKHTSVDERVAINGDEMYVYYYALRNGFSVEEDKPVSSRPEVARRAKDVRVYVHIETPGQTTLPRMKGQLLEQGQWWRVYCVDEHGCERTHS